MSSGEIDITQLWTAVAPLARSRVALLEEYVEALPSEADEAQQRDAACTAAHQLAGALGTYGRSGSEQAALLEHLLRAGGAAPDVDQVRRLVRELRLAVEA